MSIATVVVSEARSSLNVVVSEARSSVNVSPEVADVTVSTSGPSGPPGPTGPPGPPGLVLDDSARVNQSVVYYDAATSSYKADSNWTFSTITDGGNF